jgi:hypothetical protein
MPPEIPERVAVLEANVGHIREDVAGIRSDFKDVRDAIKEIRGDITALKVGLSTVQENIRHLPTITVSLGILATLVAVIVGVVGLGPKIQTFFGTVPTSSGATRAESTSHGTNSIQCAEIVMRTVFEKTNMGAS